MTKKIPVMCTCPYVLLQWFSVSLYSPYPSFPLLVCVSLPFPALTPLSLIKSALVHALVSSLWSNREKPFCECYGMWGRLPVVYVLHIPGCMFGGGVCLAWRLLMFNRVCVTQKAFGEWSHDLWGHFINYICDIQPDEFPLWLNDMMNINDLGWITLLLLLLLMMIMCFTTLGEWGGKLHTTAHLGHKDFHMQHFKDHSLCW